jgi:DNA-directed RNA polymerase alpha subunit
LETPLKELGCSARVCKAFRRMNLVTIGDLVAMDIADFALAKNIGEHSVNEVREKLFALGLAMRNDRHLPAWTIQDNRSRYRLNQHRRPAVAATT